MMKCCCAMRTTVIAYANEVSGGSTVITPVCLSDSYQDT